MTGPLLFLRARSTGVALTVIIAVGIIEKILGQAGVIVSRGFDINVPWSVILPMATGVVVATCTHTTFGGLERTGARPLPTLRAVQLGLLVVVAVLVATWSTTALEGLYTTPAAIRNTLGFTGIALLAAVILGAATAWLPTIAYGIAAATAGTKVGVAQTWAWPIHPDADTTSWTLALLLLAAGAAAVIARGPRATGT